MQGLHHHVRLYTRPGCHLCEEVEDLLEQLGRQLSLRVEPINILADPQLYEQYKWRIPVVVIDEGLTLCAPIDELSLRRALGA